MGINMFLFVFNYPVYIKSEQNTFEVDKFWKIQY